MQYEMTFHIAGGHRKPGYDAAACVLRQNWSSSSQYPAVFNTMLNMLPHLNLGQPAAPQNALGLNFAQQPGDDYSYKVLKLEGTPKSLSSDPTAHNPPLVGTRARLIAVITALEWVLERYQQPDLAWLRPSLRIVVKTDCQCVAGCLTKAMRRGRLWVGNGGRDWKNLDLLRRVARLHDQVVELGEVEVRYEYVRKEENEEARGVYWGAMDEMEREWERERKEEEAVQRVLSPRQEECRPPDDRNERETLDDNGKGREMDNIEERDAEQRLSRPEQVTEPDERSETEILVETRDESDWEMALEDEDAIRRLLRQDQVQSPAREDRSDTETLDGWEIV